MDPKWKRDVDLAVKTNPLALVAIIKSDVWSDTQKLYAFTWMVNAVGQKDAVELLGEAR